MFLKHWPIRYSSYIHRLDLSLWYYNCLNIVKLCLQAFYFQARQILKGFKVKTKIAIELCDIVSVAELLVEQPLAKEGCPYLTRSLADGIMYRWPALHNAR